MTQNNLTAPSRLTGITLEGVVPRVFASDSEWLAARGAAADSAGALWGGSVTLRRGSFYIVRAESGEGKSSLCAYLYGERRDYDGRITFGYADGRSVDASRLDMDGWCALRRTSLAIVTQEMALFPRLTVAENIDVKNRLTRYRDAAWISRALDRMEISHRSDWPAERLSVGQRQRVAIIRALCQPFDFMLLDEPVSHLDTRRAAIAARFLAEEAGAAGASLVVTSVGNDLPLGPESAVSLRL